MSDPISTLSALEALRPHVEPHSVPFHLRKASIEIASEIDALLRRLELDPSLRPSLSSSELDVLGEMDAVRP